MMYLLFQIIIYIFIANISKMKNLTKEQLFELYITQEKTANEIAKSVGKSTITIQRWLQKYSLKKRELIVSAICNKEDVEQLLLTHTHQEIADKYNITLYQFRGFLRTHIQNPSKGHFIDESLINENLPMFWYLIGIITTDGHISSKGNTVSIFQKDAVFLNKLKQYFKSEGSLNRKIGGLYTLYLTSPKLKKFLITNGFDSDKRYNVPFLNCPKQYLHYYLRGIFDGDGCIFYNYTSGTLKSRTLQITSGSQNLVNGIINNYDIVDWKLQEKTSTTGNKYWDVFASTKEDIVTIGNYIYSGDFIEYCLKRKFIQFIKFKKLLEIDKMVI